MEDPACPLGSQQPPPWHSRSTKPHPWTVLLCSLASCLDCESAVKGRYVGLALMFVPQHLGGGAEELWKSTQGQSPEILGLFRFTEVLLGFSLPAAGAGVSVTLPQLCACIYTRVCSHIYDLSSETLWHPVLPQHKPGTYRF